eukprot:scaffold86828_cov26-Tisochrysis_lutea.AAC.1
MATAWRALSSCESSKPRLVSSDVSTVARTIQGLPPPFKRMCRRASRSTARVSGLLSLHGGGGGGLHLGKVGDPGGGAARDNTLGRGLEGARLDAQESLQLIEKALRVGKQVLVPQEEDGREARLRLADGGIVRGRHLGLAHHLQNVRYADAHTLLLELAQAGALGIGHRVGDATLLEEDELHRLGERAVERAAPERADDARADCIVDRVGARGHVPASVGRHAGRWRRGGDAQARIERAHRERLPLEGAQLVVQVGVALEELLLEAAHAPHAPADGSAIKLAHAAHESGAARAIVEDLAQHAHLRVRVERLLHPRRAGTAWHPHDEWDTPLPRRTAGRRLSMDCVAVRAPRLCARLGARCAGARGAGGAFAEAALVCGAPRGARGRVTAGGGGLRKRA